MENIEKKKLFLRLASVLQMIIKNSYPVLDQTDKWPIDFHEIILLRDVPDEQQLKLKDTYKKLSERQQRKSSSNWRKV